MPRKPLTFDDVQAIGSELPDVETRTAYGAPALKVRNTLLTCPAINKSAEPDSIVVRIGIADRDRLLKEQPDVYYLTPHYSPYPCIVARLARIRRDELRELLGAGWRYVIDRAPQRATKKRAKRATRGKTSRR